jgi:hypothetical protein
MTGFEEIKKVTAEIVGSYETRVCAVGEIIEKSLAMLDQYRRGVGILHNRLRETLAKVESLRKKDFDLLMAPLLSYQEKKEQEIKESMTAFLKKQREMARQLQRVVQAGIVLKIPVLEEEIKQTISEAKKSLTCFQKEQALIGEKMAFLLSKETTLTLKEFKGVLETLQREIGLPEETKIQAMARG